MNRYLIYLEGAHDLAVIGQILETIDFLKIEKIEEIDKDFRQLIPREYPFSNDGKLDRIVPIPDFYKKGIEIEVSLTMSNSENSILKRIDDDLERVTSRDILETFKKIIVFLDADDLLREEKIKSFSTSSLYKSSGEAKIYNHIRSDEFLSNRIIVKKLEIPVSYYLFPDDTNKGVLEDIILSAINSKEREEAEKFVEKMMEISNSSKELLEKGNSNKKKAIVSCVGNTVISPSSSGTVYISKSKWIKTGLERDENLIKIKKYLEENLK